MSTAISQKKKLENPTPQASGKTTAFLIPQFNLIYHIRYTRIIPSINSNHFLFGSIK